MSHIWYTGDVVYWRNYKLILKLNFIVSIPENTTDFTDRSYVYYKFCGSDFLRRQYDWSLFTSLCKVRKITFELLVFYTPPHPHKIVEVLVYFSFYLDFINYLIWDTYPTVHKICLWINCFYNNLKNAKVHFRSLQWSINVFKNLFKCNY